MPGVSFKNNIESFLFKNIPAATNLQGKTIYISDVGQDGSFWSSNGTYWNPIGGEYILKSEPTEITSNGSNVESVLSQVFIPAGLFITGDVIEVDLYLEKSGTVDTSTVRIRVGSTGTVSDSSITSIGQPATTSKSLRPKSHLKVIDGTSIQSVTAPIAATVGVSTSTTSVATAGIDFSLDSYVSFCTLMTTGGIETATLKKIIYKHITARV